MAWAMKFPKNKIITNNNNNIYSCKQQKSNLITVVSHYGTWTCPSHQLNNKLRSWLDNKFKP